VTVINDDSNRRPIPRWRSFLSAANFGELLSLKSRDPASVPKWDGDEQREAWRRNPTFSVAADLVSAAYTSGRKDIGHDAAEFLLISDDDFPLIKHIARKHLGRANADDASSPQNLSPQPTENYISSEIRRSRSLLRTHPINPVLWSNLALLFTVAGEPQKAERAMLTALKLSPTNRFILRSAARFFLHHGDADRAHAVLVNAASIRSDPWLLASEIAIADVRGRSSRFIKLARRMVDAKIHEPFHVSEVCSALATIEAVAGDRRKAKKLSSSAMADPAENSIAQAAWLFRQFDIAQSDAPSRRQIVSNEANAWNARTVGDWDRALSESKKWLAEQPFSSRPANFSCYVAATATEDYDDAVRIALQAWQSNRDDAVLINNLAFSYANLGEVEKAKEWIEKGNRCANTSQNKICLIATSGLTAFRAGYPELGRRLYRNAIKMAKSEQRDDLTFVATIYSAVEELRIGSAFAAPAKREALESANRMLEPYRALFIRKIELADTPSEQVPR